MNSDVDLAGQLGHYAAGLRRMREFDIRRVEEIAKKRNLTKDQLVDNDDCVDDDKGYWMRGCVSYVSIPSGRGWRLGYRVEQLATYSG